MRNKRYHNETITCGNCGHTWDEAYKTDSGEDNPDNDEDQNDSDDDNTQDSMHNKPTPQENLAKALVASFQNRINKATNKPVKPAAKPADEASAVDVLSAAIKAARNERK